MIAAIEAQGRHGYGARMRSMMMQMLALVAVLLMPLGMTAAPAAGTQHHAASMPMPHCPDQGTRHQQKGAFAECTMACASALPAVDGIVESPVPYAATMVAAALVQELHGLHPDPATPPPKIA